MAGSTQKHIVLYLTHNTDKEEGGLLLSSFEEYVQKYSTKSTIFVLSFFNLPGLLFNPLFEVASYFTQIQIFHESANLVQIATFLFFVS